MFVDQNTDYRIQTMNITNARSRRHVNTCTYKAKDRSETFTLPLELSGTHITHIHTYIHTYIYAYTHSYIYAYIHTYRYLQVHTGFHTKIYVPGKRGLLRVALKESVQCPGFHSLCVGVITVKPHPRRARQTRHHRPPREVSSYHLPPNTQ